MRIIKKRRKKKNMEGVLSQFYDFKRRSADIQKEADTNGWTLELAQKAKVLSEEIEVFSKEFGI